MDKNIRKEVEDMLLSKYESLYRLAYSYAGNEADALDIIQESAYRAMLNCGSVKRTEYIGTWIYRIVVNTATDMLRRKKRTVSVEIIEEQGCEDRISDQDLRKALKELDENDKAIIFLKFCEDLTFSEIAEVTGENENTVKTRYYRLMGRLRNKLEG